ncbi:MAG TPA: hypothetical protein DHW49_03780 [Anaerolineae bacterium]|nr:hypothetical protein [Anaerolineae bacterium]
MAAGFGSRAKREKAQLSFSHYLAKSIKSSKRKCNMKKIVSLLFIFAFIISACGGSEPLQITDPTQTIEVNAGEEFTIVIESNPTTGYHWEIMSELSNVEFISKDYQAEEPITTGSGGVDLWTFKAISTGEALITLGYYPPYEDPEPPQQTTTFVVTVK